MSAEVAFRKWFSQEQPMIHIQDQAQKKIYDQAIFRAVRDQIESAYRAGWEAKKLEELRRIYDGADSQ